MSKVQSIPLGSAVQDILTGVTGIASVRCDLIAGNTQYTVQPKSKDGDSMPDAWNIDEHTLEVTGPGISDRATPVPEDTVVFQLGQKLRCRITGFEGIASGRMTHMNGCVFYRLDSKMGTSKETGALAQGLQDVVNVKQLELVDQGIYVPPATDAAPEEKPARAPGGFTTRAMRF